MAALRRCMLNFCQRRLPLYVGEQIRASNTLVPETVEKHRKHPLNKDRVEEGQTIQDYPKNYQYVYPEFLPHPIHYYRDRVKDRLERRDMLKRRAVVDIPEFHVGSILAVTASDHNAPAKANRFVGICIDKGGQGLRAHFILRNIVDGLGVEIKYDMYNPTLQKIEVLKLERRLDDELFYLRDADPKYCTIPFNFERVPHPPGATVPVNDILIPLNPRPWHERWERREMKGIHPSTWQHISERMKKRRDELATPWEKYDLMKQYRKTANDIEMQEIMSDVYGTMKDVEKDHLKKRLVELGPRKK